MALRPPMEWKHTGRLASVALTSVLNSTLNRMESLFYHRRIRSTEIDTPPIFILGHWRSGTTLLHNLLTLAPDTNYCNLYQVLFPGSFLLTENFATRLTAGLLPKTRPMDGMPLTWHHPQEDETALLMRTLLSPYLMLAFHNDPSVYDRYFTLRSVSEHQRQQWKDALLWFSKKLTVRRPGRLIFKSPGHTFRIPLLLDIFPDAKFLMIYRNPYRVFSSTMHLRRTMFRDNGFASLDDSSLEEMTLDVYSRLFETYEEDRHLIPEGNLHEIRFEDLEHSPANVVRGAYEALGLPDFDRLEPCLKQYFAQHGNHRKNQYTLEKGLMQRIYDEWQAAFERYGYSETGDAISPVAA
jgi:hypothetical protein